MYFCSLLQQQSSRLPHLKVSIKYRIAIIQCCIVILDITTVEYVATVIAYPENGSFRSCQLVPLKCTITPTPPFPVVYIWRSSTPNHYPEDSFPSTTPITTITINENHPLHGRYFCHVLSASNHTTLAVGYVDIRVKGKVAFTRLSKQTIKRIL